jgi:hypothetical protein
MDYKIINNKYKNIIFIIFFIIIFHFLFLYKKDTIENFGLKDIGKIGKSVNSIGKTVGNLPKQIDRNMSSLSKQIEKNTVVFFEKKIKSIFIQLGNVFNKGIIHPILSLLIGIGSIFVFIFKVLENVVDKIVSLPNCILFYGVGSIGSFSNMIYKSIIPKSIRNIIYKIYSYTFKFIIDWIGYITGYTRSSKKCYSFNVNREISNMSKNFKKISIDFRKNFGRLNFSSIKF